MLDIKIIGARVVDGTGNPWRRMDVGILDGRIHVTGVVREPARKRLDGRGLVLCPGFIDVHTHADGIVTRPGAENLLRQGITTVVSGNCGSSALPVGEMLDRVDAALPSINYATLVGHGTIRRQVMDKAARKPARRELTQMKRLAEDAMREGALGMSTGLFYIPGAYAELAELVELSKTIGAAGGIYVTHARSAGGKLPEAITETAEIGRRAGLPVHVSHLKALHRRGRTGNHRAAEMLALIERFRADGIDLTYDLHPYPATNTSLSAVALPPWVSADGRRDERLRDPTQRKRMREEVIGNLAWNRGAEHIRIVGFPSDPSLEGMTLAQIAVQRKQPAEFTAMDLVLEGDARCIFYSLREADVQQFLSGAYSMVASDGGVVQNRTRLVHPRNYGTFPHVLRAYVRENGWLRLETAIRKMTAYPAARFRIPNRGMIAPGYAADLVLFDPERIAEQTTFEAPHAYPEGLNAVLVNGVVAWRAGSERVARGCGRALRCCE